LRSQPQRSNYGASADESKRVSQSLPASKFQICRYVGLQPHMRLTPRRSLGAATTCQEDRYTNGVGQRRPSASTPRRWKPSASTPRRWRPSATTTHRFQEAATQTLPELGRERPEGVASKVGDPTHCLCHPARGSPRYGTGFRAPSSLPLAGGQGVNAGSDVAGTDHPNHPGTVITTSGCDRQPMTPMGEVR
jgi:hypothetical protein